MKRRPVLFSLLVLIFLVLFNVFPTVSSHSPQAEDVTQSPQHSQVYGCWQNVWLNTHKLLSKYYPHKDESKVGAISNTYLAIADLKVQIANDKKLSSGNGESRLYDVSSGSSYIAAGGSQKQTYIYISENGANDVILCKLGLNNISDCTVTLGGLLKPTKMVIINKIFYMLSYSEPIMYSCSLGNSGAIESCSQNPVPLNNPNFIIYNDYTLFISDLEFTNMSQCDLDYNFGLIDCKVIPPTISQNSFINSEAYGYQYRVTYDPHTYIGSVNKCVGNACNVLPDVNLPNPTTVKIFNNTAYILDANTNNLVGCKLQANGDFLSCSVLKSGLRMALDIAFYSPTSQ